MKTGIAPILFALAVKTLFMPSSATADLIYTWTPDGTAAGAANGGNGEWNLTGLNWWDGSVAIARGATDAPFGSVSEDAHLVFNGTGMITVKFTINFAGDTSRTHSLDFTSGSNYTIDNPGGAFIGSGKANMKYNVAPTATLTLGGSGGQVAIVSGSDLSGAPGLIFGGGGTINLKAGALVRNNSANGRLAVRENTTVNFFSGSVYTGPGGSVAAPTPSIDHSRISLENGTINVNGGTIVSGYRGTTSSNANLGFGIQIGGVASGSGATFNLNSGTVTALGDPRSSGISYAGLNFGKATGDIGGTFNLNGGTFIVTNIRSTAGLQNAALNFNGGVIKVSTALSSTDATVTNAQLQSRLDEFIAGFSGTATNRITIGAGGVTFDTSGIDAARTNGVATIKSGMYGAGDLTKVGANTLNLDAANTYTGKTIVNGGKLAIGASGSISNSSEIVINNNATFDVQALSQGFNLVNGQILGTSTSGTILGNLKTSGGRIELSGALTIDGNLEANAGTVFSFDLGASNVKLTLSGDIVLSDLSILDLSRSSAFGEGSYILFEAASITGNEMLIANGAPAFAYSFTNTGNTLVLNVASIPEPACWAFALTGLAVVGAVSTRRR